MALERRMMKLQTCERKTLRWEGNMLALGFNQRRTRQVINHTQKQNDYQTLYSQIPPPPIPRSCILSFTTIDDDQGRAVDRDHTKLITTYGPQLVASNSLPRMISSSLGNFLSSNFVPLSWFSVCFRARMSWFTWLRPLGPSGLWVVFGIGAFSYSDMVEFVCHYLRLLQL